ncbi:MAG: hypothetical protein A2287_09020 [Candidatus Melainabacteria bacterium RIFOXYA12_FULL_32_12]|nr:MAG: hypothetical protein A2104_00360 [Candidatus Melainabacteria bacterium GWF2_32_7]OGI21198.1 MAG: hypothetical protein A2255_05045 [Candidatus Melainabacteria bacterium RIFOXYA2_FULL_32_9]OGI28771.1 MAG: hypothetical protein A2287_09020 [Candidatus Melainabacteria bacterium RIFOXYA12_FULL_32_12]
MSPYIGARDRIDQLLVQKYADMKTNNLDNHMEMSVDRFWKLMGIVAQYEKAIVEMKKPKQAAK